jgi:DNA-binding protein H-NS
MATDLSGYTRDQLQQLQKDIDKEIKARKREEEKQARQELKEVAQKYGFSLDELIAARGGTKSSGSKGNSDPKYVNPDDPSKTWSGRGRKPAWVKEWEQQGRSLEQARVR